MNININDRIMRFLFTLNIKIRMLRTGILVERHSERKKERQRLRERERERWKNEKHESERE